MRKLVKAVFVSKKTKRNNGTGFAFLNATLYILCYSIVKINKWIMAWQNEKATEFGWSAGVKGTIACLKKYIYLVSTVSVAL